MGTLFRKWPLKMGTGLAASAAHPRWNQIWVPPPPPPRPRGKTIYSSYLKRHKYTHTGRNSHSCEQSEGNHFPIYLHLKIHKCVHTGEKSCSWTGVDPGFWNREGGANKYCVHAAHIPSAKSLTAGVHVKGDLRTICRFSYMKVYKLITLGTKFKTLLSLGRKITMFSKFITNYIEQGWWHSSPTLKCMHVLLKEVNKRGRHAYNLHGWTCLPSGIVMEIHCHITGIFEAAVRLRLPSCCSV